MRNIRKVFFKKLTLLFSIYLLFFQSLLFSPPGTQVQSEQKQNSKKSRRAKKILDAKKKQDQQVAAEVFLKKQAATNNQKSKKSRAVMAQAQVFTPQKAPISRQLNTPTISPLVSQQTKPIVFKPVKLMPTPVLVQPVLSSPVLAQPIKSTPVLEQPAKVIAPIVSAPIIAPVVAPPVVAPEVVAAPVKIAELKTFDHVVIAPPVLSSPEVIKVPDLKLEINVPSIRGLELVPDSIPPYDGPLPIIPSPAETLEPLPQITLVLPPGDEPKEASYSSIPVLDLNLEPLSDFEKVGAFDIPLFFKKTDKPVLGKEEFDPVEGPKPFGQNPNNSNPPNSPQIQFGVLGGRTTQPEKVIDPGGPPEELQDLKLKALTEILPRPEKVTGNPGSFNRTITIDRIPKVESITLVDKSELLLNLIEIYKSLSSNHQNIQKILRTMSVEGFPEISLSIGAIDGVFKNLDTTEGIKVDDKFSFGGQLFQTSSMHFEFWNTWTNQLVQGTLTDDQKQLKDLFNIVFSENSYNSPEQYLFNSKKTMISDNSGGRKTLNLIIHTYGSVAVYARCVIKYCLGLMCLNILKENSSNYKGLPATVHNDLEKTGNELSKKIKRFFDEQNKLIKFKLMTLNDAFILQKAFLKSCIFGLSGNIKKGVKRLDWTLDVSGHLKELFWKKKVLLGKLALINSQKNDSVSKLIESLDPKISQDFSDGYYSEPTINPLQKTLSDQISNFETLKNKFGIELDSVDCNLSSIGDKIKILISSNGTSSQKLIKIFENIKKTLSVTIPQSNDNELRIIKTNFNLIDPYDEKLDAKNKVIPNFDPQDPKEIIQNIQDYVLEEYKKSVSESLFSEKEEFKKKVTYLKSQLQELSLEIISDNSQLKKQFDEAIVSLINIETNIEQEISLDFGRIKHQLDELSEWINNNSEVIKTHNIKFKAHKIASDKYSKDMKSYAQLLFQRLKGKINRGSDLKNNWVALVKYSQAKNKYETELKAYNLAKSKYEKYKQELSGWQSDDKNYEQMLADYNKALIDYESAFKRYEKSKLEYEAANKKYIFEKQQYDEKEKERFELETIERSKKIKAQDDSNKSLNKTWAAKVFQKNYRHKVSAKNQAEIINQLVSRCEKKKEEVDRFIDDLKNKLEAITSNDRFANQDLISEATAPEFDGIFSKNNLDQALLVLEKAKELVNDKIGRLRLSKREQYGKSLSLAIVNYLDSISLKVNYHNRDIDDFLKNSRITFDLNEKEEARAKVDLEIYNQKKERYEKYLKEESDRELENQRREELNQLEYDRVAREEEAYKNAKDTMDSYVKKAEGREELIKGILEKNRQVSISNEFELDLFKTGINSFISEILSAVGEKPNQDIIDLINIEKKFLSELVVSSETLLFDIQVINDKAEELKKAATEVLQKKSFLNSLPTEKNLIDGKNYIETNLDILKLNIDGLSEHLNEINSKVVSSKKLENLFDDGKNLLDKYSSLIDLSDELALARRQIRILRKDEVGDTVNDKKEYENKMKQFYGFIKDLNNMVSNLQSKTRLFVISLKQ